MKKLILLFSISFLIIFSSCKKDDSNPTTSENLSTLVAYYPFNGNANDESGNGNNGTVDGATLTVDRFGFQNKAYSFNGTDNEIQVPHTEALNILTNLTISAWFNSIEAPLFRTSHTILAKRSQSSFGSFPYLLAINYQYSIPSDYKKPIFVTAANNNYQYLQSTTDISNNSWNHIVSVISNNNLRIFLNGTLILNTTVNPQLRVGNSASLLIGSGARSDKPAEQFKGQIDDIRIYNRALTDSEIQTLYHEGGWQ